MDRYGWYSRKVSCWCLHYAIFQGFGVLAVLLGIPYNNGPVIDALLWWRIALAMLGVLLITFDLWLEHRKAVIKINAAKYDIKISHPVQNGVVNNIINFTGTIQKMLPDGYELRIMQVMGNNPMGYVGLEHDVASFSDDKKWTVTNCSILGSGGQSIELCVFIVGSCGRVLLEYFVDACQIHNPLVERCCQNDVQKPHLPAIKGLESLPDTVKCASVNVTIT